MSGIAVCLDVHERKENTMHYFMISHLPVSSKCPTSVMYRGRTEILQTKNDEHLNICI